MVNQTIYNYLIRGYNQYSFTHLYIFGFEYKGNIYYSFRSAEILPYILCLDRASRDGGCSLRYKPTKEQKLLLLQNAQVLCSKEFFESEVKKSIYNAGETFERLFTESNGQHWAKDKIPFTEAGDIELNGKPYQIKFNKATFISERQLARLQAESSA